MKYWDSYHGIRKIFGWILILVFASTAQVFAFSRKPKTETAPETSVLVRKKYMCPMQCQAYEKPGKCGKCGMDLWEVS